MTDLKDRIAVVTGGARGLGQAIGQVLCEDGAAVVIADVRKDLAEKCAADLRERGGRAMALVMNVADAHDVREGMRRVVDEFGRLDILVNNAGVDVTVPVEEMSVEDWERIIAVNLTGPFLMSRQAFTLMGHDGGGHIVNIVSTASKRAWANASAYHASKWGLLGFSHALHVEGRKKNIKVTAIVAGGMRTPFLLDRFPDIDVDNLQDPKNVAEVVKFVITRPGETAIPEMMVMPMRETSWP